MIIRITFILFALFACSQSSFAQLENSVNLKGDENSITLDNSYLYFIENRSMESFTSEKFDVKKVRFSILNSKIPNFGFIQHDVWFYFTISNPLSSVQTCFLSLNNPNLDIAELHFIDASGKKYLLDQGDLIPLQKHQIISRKIAFKLTVPAQSKQEYFLRVNNGGEQFHFYPEIQTHDRFYERESKEQYYLGIYFGILTFVIIFNLFMWILTREKISLHYSLYLVTFLFLQLSLLGFGKLYFWSNSTYIVNHANPFFASLSVYFLLHFSRLYLDLKSLMPRIDFFFRILQYVILITAIFALIPFKWAYTSSIISVNGLTLFLNVLIIPVAIQAIRLGYKPAILFLIAFALLVISVFAFVLKNFGILPSNFFTDFGFQFGSTAEVILFSLAIIIRFRNFREEAIERLQQIAVMKDQANIKLEQKVKERTKEIEEKNNEIISSISYAKRIQEAILPPLDKLHHLLPSSALWYAPKDIVAGDFYWVEQKHFHGKDHTFFAIGDCTGHGVPGAMMSVLCTNSLNAAIAQMSAPGTSSVLEICSTILNENLSQHSTEINDGMDISLCCLEPETGTLYWSGANNPLWILRNDELIEFSGTKRPIGKSSTDQPFEEHVIHLENNDRLFLFSDGIIDQFGGTDEKKFKKSRLRECILASRNSTIEEQLNYIRAQVTQWQGELEQVDDIALLIVN
jgi:serine phosphatase RsbU (regulator of sigma subunit)